MDELNSDHSPDLCENSDSWLPWENDVPGLTGSGFNSLVEDKEIASRAVAFVVNSTRKGIVPLCTDVANLLRAKRSLEKKVLLLKKENEALRAGSRQTSHSTSPTPASLSSDRSHDVSYLIHEPYRPPSRCSQCSSTISDSPKIRQRPSSQQRSPGSTHHSGYNTSPSSQRSDREGPLSHSGHNTSPLSQRSGGEGPAKSSHSCHNTSPLAHRSDRMLLREDTHAMVHKNAHLGLDTEAVIKGSSKNGLMTRADVHVESKLDQTEAIKRQHYEKKSDKQSRSFQRSTGTKQTRYDEAEDSICNDILNIGGSFDTDKDLKYIKECLQQIEVKQCLDKLFIENELHSNPENKSKDHKGLKQNNTHNSKHKTQSSNRKWSRALSPSVTSVCSEPIKGCKCSRCQSAMLSGDEEVNDAQKFSVSYKLQVQCGDFVLAKGDKSGRICYIGHLDNTPDVLYVGLELNQPVGQHDGFYKRKRYFTCRKDHGIFIPLQEILCKLNKKSTKLQNTPKSDDKIEEITEL